METKGLPQVPAQHKRDRGQAIILVAFLMILLLGITGVAIDGGGLYFLWRDVRNATDAAAVAAVYTRCVQGVDSDWRGVGLRSAEASGFEHNSVDADGNLVTVTVGHPAADEFPGRPLENLVEVRITAEKTSYFIHVIDLLSNVSQSDDLQVSARTVAECTPGSPANLEGEENERTKYAFHTRTPNGFCTANNYALRFNGSGNDIYGDIYTDANIWGNNANAFDIYGDIAIGAPPTDPPNDNLEYLHEETTDGPLYEGHGDGTIEFNAPPISGSYDPFPFDSWSELEWGGAVQLSLGSNYHLLSCSVDGKVINQNTENGPQGFLPYDTDGNPGNGIQLMDGFYIPNYADFGQGGTCNDTSELEISGNFSGRVTIVHRGPIATSGSNNQLVPYWEGVLLASNYTRSDPQNCAGGGHAIRLSGSGEFLQGDMLVFSNGHIWANGNDSTYESCFSAWSTNITGNNSNYFCQPGGAPPENTYPSISIIQ